MAQKKWRTPEEIAAAVVQMLESSPNTKDLVVSGWRISQLKNRGYIQPTNEEFGYLITDSIAEQKFKAELRRLGH